VILLFSRYDTDKDGIIKFSEFSNALLPLNTEYAKYLLERVPDDMGAEFKEH